MDFTPVHGSARRAYFDRITNNLQQRQQGQQRAWSHLVRSQMVCRSQSQRLRSPFELQLQDLLPFDKALVDSPLCG